MSSFETELFTFSWVYLNVLSRRITEEFRLSFRATQFSSIV